MEQVYLDKGPLLNEEGNLNQAGYAFELAKEYSDEKVCKMINGVLDKVYHSKGKNE